MMRANIREQTLLLAILPMFLAVVLLDAYFLYSRFSSVEAGMVERAELLAKQIASSGEYALFSGNMEQLQDEATAALKQKDVAVIAIQNVSGNLVAYAGESMSDEDRGIIQEHGLYGLTRDTSNYFWVREPIASFAIDLSELDTVADKGTSKLLGFVFVKMNKTTAQKEKWEVLEVSSLISIVLIGLTVFFVLQVSRRIINPINALNHMVQGIGQGALSARISPIPVISELSDLALGINEMAKHLQEDRAILEGQTEKLRSSEERLNNIIDMMPVSLFINDANSRIT